MTYMIELELYTNLWYDKFCITATNADDATCKARAWGRYHSFNSNIVRVRPATNDEAHNNIHNEYVP